MPIPLLPHIRRLIDNLLGRFRGLISDENVSSISLIPIPALLPLDRLVELRREVPEKVLAAFMPGPLEDDKFLVAREKEMKALEDALLQWRAGVPTAVAITGPEGSGKTSLLNCFRCDCPSGDDFLIRSLKKRLLTEEDVVATVCEWFGFDPAGMSLPALAQSLRNEPPSAIVVEGGHNLLLRTVGGTKATEAFFYLLLATRDHHCWVVSFRKYPWDRLDCLLGLGRYFTRQINTLFHSQEELRDALQRRVEDTGFKITYLGPDGEPAGNGEGDSPYQDRFFRDLFDTCGGSLEAALYFCLLSLEKEEETGELTLRPMGKLDTAFLGTLEQSCLFTLAEIICHGGLTTAEHGAIFHRDELHSGVTLNYLLQQRLVDLTPCGEDERYVLNPIVYQPVTAALRQANILY